MNDNFKNRMNRCIGLHEKKAKDYSMPGNRYSNFAQAETVAHDFHGVDKVFATLVGIKLARLSALFYTGQTPMNESISDTFDDLVVYCALWGAYREDEY